MDYRIMAPIVVLAVFGIVLIGEAMSGFATLSQTCCFPPNCDPENLCSSKSNPNPQFAYIGVILIGISLLLFIGLRYKY